MRKLLLDLIIFSLVAVLLAVSVLNALNTSGLFGGNDGEPEESVRGNADMSFLLPEFIGAKGERLKSVGLLANLEATAEVYSFLAPLLRAALTEGEGEYVKESWNDLLASKDFVYLRYHSEYTASMISLHLGGSHRMKAENPNVCEILIVLGGTEHTVASFTVYAKDASGALCRFNPQSQGYYSNGLYFDIEAFSTFADLSGNSDFEFFVHSNASGVPERALMSSSQPLLSTPPSVRGVRFENVGSALSSEFLALVGFPPATLGTYTDEDGATVYINTLGSLKQHGNALAFEAAIDGGLRLAGTNEADGAYSVLEGIFAIEKLISDIRAVQPASFGNDAYLMLTDAKSDGSALTLRFDYFFDNVRIFSSDGTPLGIDITVENGKVTKANADLLCVTDISYRIKNYPMQTVLRVLTPSISPESYSLLRLAYRESDGDCYTEWLVENE